MTDKWGANRSLRCVLRSARATSIHEGLDHPRAVFHECHNQASRFLANQFRLLAASAARVLIEQLRRIDLAGTELAKAGAATIPNRPGSYKMHCYS